MMSNIKNITFIFVFLLGVALGAKGQSASDHVDTTQQIEIRQVTHTANGAIQGGSIPDSLYNHYFIDKQGRVYKYFNSFEQVIAHYNGNAYSRDRTDAPESIVYVHRCSTLQQDTCPEQIEINSEGTFKVIK